MKKLTLPQILSFMTLAFLVVSCSSEPKTQPEQKAYSSDTQKEFEAIEKNDLRTNPPYRSTIKQAPRPPVVIKETPREKQKEVIKETPGTSPTTEAADVSQLSAKNQERLQEINQNLAFFCMKHRKDKIFQDEEHCLAYTKKILKACEKKHKLINTVMVNCIKDQLKKRK
jgi:PBP1b-binding outer membrane lipoprotein LpoB